MDENKNTNYYTYLNELAKLKALYKSKVTKEQL